MEKQILRVREKGQITLTKKIRDNLHINENDYVIAEVVNEKIILYKLPNYNKASFDDGIWNLIGSAEDKEGKTDISSNKHKYLGDKQ
ncbi:MAG TPA: AbrB/MazE/SpoVT family DNA-binding domain-containing protein [Thermoanaerobacterales bacterium]|nr:AbrB/MazE/SpoVT family DNA-binding domain-containing protein [Thermoanaerobacterales bacterium]